MASIKQADPVAISQQWTSSMEAALAKQSITDIVALFNQNGWWRDILVSSIHWTLCVPSNIL